MITNAFYYCIFTKAYNIDLLNYSRRLNCKFSKTKQENKNYLFKINFYRYIIFASKVIYIGVLNAR